MKRIKKFIVLNIVFAILFSTFSACFYDDETPESSVPSATPRASAALLFDGSDSLDPFIAKTAVNHQLFSLVFPGLFINTSSALPEPFAVSDFSVSGAKVTFKLNEVKFSDGSLLTPSDVVSSFDYAKKSTKYASRFNYITKYGISNNEFYVIFKNYPETNLSLLDIPIVKRTETGVLGLGEYAFLKKENVVSLIKNNYFNSPQFKVSEIFLEDIDDISSAVHSFNKKSVSAISINASTNTVIIKGSYEKKSYITDNLIFIGFNCNKWPFNYASVRKAFNLALNRQALSEEDRSDFANFVWNPVNPNHYLLNSFELPSSIYMPDISHDLLSSNGFSKRKGFYNMGSFSLIVNSEDSFKVNLAKSIVSQLKNFGIDVSLKVLDYDAYTAALKAGNFDLFLGETVMPINADVSILASSTLNYGNWGKASLDALYNALASQNLSSNAFDRYIDDSPVISVCYRRNSLVYSRIFPAEASPSRFLIYNSLFFAEIS